VNDPLVDIVMLVHDKAEWADLAIRAVEHHTKNKYRLIIVDMASEKPETRMVLADAEKRGHAVYHLAENRSFSSGVNYGVERGSAPFIILLNDDAIVTEGWDTALLQDAAPKFTGLVGARSNFVAGAQGDPSFTGKPPFLAFVCVALRREVWNIVGPMDDQTFDGFSGEDLDYSWRVEKAGYALKVSNAFVLHAGSRTLAAKVGDAAARAANDQRYMNRLVEKWGAEHVTKRTRLRERVFVVSYHMDAWTRVRFMDAFVAMKFGTYAFDFFRQIRAPIAFARNVIFNHAVKAGYDVLIQIDDDATFPPDTIHRLLSHQKPVVTALAYQRKPPHATCVFTLGDDGLMGNAMEGIEHTGLRKVDVSGYHLSAIRVQEVHAAMKKAGITENWYGGFDNKVGEDFAFSLNLKKAGVPLYCDTDLISGHIGEEIVVDEAYKREFIARGGK